MTTKTVFVFPYLQLSSGKYGVKEVRIGPATFWPDDNATWNDVIKTPRPPWLEIYRDFPSGAGQEAPPARGTILIAEDDDWLKVPGHVENAVAVLYVLGQPLDKWNTPAEAFFHIDFQAQAQYHDIVSIPTKFHVHWETVESLHLFPSLELRGTNRSYRVTSDSPEATELLSRFVENPDDRLVIGCYHLFRAQFADRFSLPLRQDYSAYCACLEALLNIDGTQDAISQAMIRQLNVIYPNIPGLDRWIKGLYCERSVFNHGASDKVMPPGYEDLFAARDEFRARGAENNLYLLKRICLDVLHDSLRDSGGTEGSESRLELARMWSPTQGLVLGFFKSDAMWTELNAHFSQKKSATEILSYTEEKTIDFMEDCASFLRHHKWHFMQDLPARARLINALKSCALAIVKHPEASDADKDGATKLGEATKSGNDELDHWSGLHRLWEQSYSSEISSLPYLKAVAAHIAALFEARTLVSKLA